MTSRWPRTRDDYKYLAWYHIAVSGVIVSGVSYDWMLFILSVVGIFTGDEVLFVGPALLCVVVMAMNRVLVIKCLKDEKTTGLEVLLAVLDYIGFVLVATAWMVHLLARS